MATPEYDVLIVGAGAAGSLLAYELANSDSPPVNVMILEAGPEFGVKNSSNEWESNIEDRVDAYFDAPAKVPSSPWPDAPEARRPTVLEVSSTETWQNDEVYLRQKGPVAFSSTYERYAGGTANHWLGTALRMASEDFELASRYKVSGARDWPISYTDLEPFYKDAEQLIGVSGNDDDGKELYGANFPGFPMPEIPNTYLDQQFRDALRDQTINGERVHVRSTPQARNSQWYQGRPPCVGNSSCVPVCPIRAKYDPSHHLASAIGATQPSSYPHSHLRAHRYPEPATNPAQISYRSVATRVEVGPDGKISGVYYKTWDDKDSEIKVTARIYVICAHAIETAKLLLMSPWVGGAAATVANSSGQVGRNLMDHTILLAWGLARNPVYPFRGPLSTTGIHDFRFGKRREERAAYIIEIGNEGWNWPTGAPFSTVYNKVKDPAANPRDWFGVELRKQVREEGVRQVRLAAEFEGLPSPESRVTLSTTHVDALGLPRPEIHYNPSDYTKRAYDEAMATMTGILEKLGVEEVLHAVDPSSPSVFTLGDNTYQFRGAGHIMGTHLMGADSATSVTDGNCRSHDHCNLYLVGGGAFPSAGTANPTLTILALALKARNQIIQDLNTEADL